MIAMHRLEGASQGKHTEGGFAEEMRELSFDLPTMASSTVAEKTVNDLHSANIRGTVGNHLALKTGSPTDRSGRKSPYKLRPKGSLASLDYDRISRTGVLANRVSSIMVSSHGSNALPWDSCPRRPWRSKRDPVFGDGG